MTAILTCDPEALMLARPPRRAGEVYESARERAIRQQHDTEYAVRLGLIAARKLARRTRVAILRAFRTGAGTLRPLDRMFDELRELLVQAMVYGQLRGRERAAKDVGQLTTIAAARSPAYTRGIAFLRRRMKLTEEEIAALEATADKHVLRVLATSKQATERALQRAILEIHAKNLHVGEAVKELRKAWDSAGLSERNSFQLEAIVRTQTQLAYSAGAGQLYEDPDIDEILWGYKYVTVGDDRVRDSHIALDGVTLPKDDPFWETNTPPNGWACRCQTIPIFRERKVVRPPDKVEIDGKIVRQGADPGFGFRPSSLLRTG